MFVTMNERPAGDGHDIVLVVQAAEVASDSSARKVMHELASSLNVYGFTQESDNLTNYVRHAADHAKTIQRHESADGTDNDNE